MQFFEFDDSLDKTIVNLDDIKYAYKQAGPSKFVDNPEYYVMIEFKSGGTACICYTDEQKRDVDYECFLSDGNRTD